MVETEVSTAEPVVVDALKATEAYGKNSPVITLLPAAGVAGASACPATAVVTARLPDVAVLARRAERNACALDPQTKGADGRQGHGERRGSRIAVASAQKDGADALAARRAAAVLRSVAL